MSFIHLRTASAYSFKYGTTQPRDLVARASEFEMPALALTDRDGLAGAIRFTKACVAHGIAPIIGINLPIYLGDTAGVLPRLTILAHSDNGWSSMVRLMTGAAVMVAQGKMSRQQLLDFIDPGDVHYSMTCPHCAPADGLTLRRVLYA